jgi:drug/metabolite transporter (DMT)-like permease
MGWLAVALFGLVDGACFQGFLAEGLQRTSAGLGSVIIDSQPLTVALLASLLFGERLGPVGWAGLAAGTAGLSLLEIPPESISLLFFGGGDPVVAIGIGGIGGGAGIITDGMMMGDLSSIASSLPPSPPWSIWDSGEWWMLLAAQSMAVGTVMVRWVAKYCDPVVATGWHMILGGIPLALLAYTQDGATLGERLSQLTGTDALLLLYVSVLGSAASYGVFFYEATVRGNLTALSSLTFLTPMFAAGGGYLFLGEVLTPVQLAGAAVTLGAVTMINKDGGGGDTSSK